MHFALASKKNISHKLNKSHKLISASSCNLRLINEFYNLADFQYVNQIYGLSVHSSLFFWMMAKKQNVSF